MRLARAAAVAWLAFGTGSCARTGLLVPDADDGAGGQGSSAPIDACAVDADCFASDPCLVPACRLDDSKPPHLTCQTTPLDCDDGDACTLDSCDSTQGGCVHERPADANHDGFLGKAPDGVPAVCGGDDCDDTDPSVHPGAPELCDGKDDDCNGAIDDGAVYAPGTAVLVAPGMARSEVGGIVADGSNYALTYTYADASFHRQSYFELLSPDGQVTAGPSRVSDINSDTFSGALAFSGSSFVSVWSDARQSANYEIYATRFDAQAQKLEADQRVTNAPGFSLDPHVRFTGSEFVTVWDDQRFEAQRGPGAIFAHALDEQGAPTGSEVRLSGDDEDADSSSFAVLGDRLGLAYVVAGPAAADGSNTTVVRFRSFDLAFADATGSVDLGTNGQEPVVESVGDVFVVTWATGNEQAGWGGALQAATLDARGNLLVESAITSGDVHAKTRAFVSLGDRAVLVWSATAADGAPFSLYRETFTPALAIVEPRSLLVASRGLGYDLTEPALTLGPKGDLAVTFYESTSYASYFMRLACASAAK